MKIRIAVMISVALSGLAALATSATVGCNATDEAILRALGEGCLVNSDCEDNLACVFRRCHEQCNTTDDCPLTASGERLRCVLGDQPSHVCQLDDERECAYSSECPVNQVCGPDAECRDQCAADRDCVKEQVCTQRVCADQEELSPGTRVLPVAERPDDQQTGLPCEYNNECEGHAPAGGPEFVCRSGICAYECFADIDCAPNQVCAKQDMAASTPGRCALGTPAGPILCAPGQQITCECFGGETDDGVQICDDDGLGYGPCRADGAGGAGGGGC